MRAVSIAATAPVLVLVIAGCGGTKKSGKGESEGEKTTIAGLSANDHGIDAQTIDQGIDSGKGAAVTIPKSGQLSFFCEYHKSMGMAGALAASG